MRLNSLLDRMVPDEQLWLQSQGGDREAFGQIVERYQTLICSLAYSACGDLARSQDLAQETFLAAWDRLSELREPSKLRAWLCAIVRNRTANALRRDYRRGGPLESLDTVAEERSLDDDPASQAVTREEEALLWQTLGGLPENYREPMVLFYREHQSIKEVASGLDLSEEVVKQRLSRGRSMLREELARVVESTLLRTRPTSAFTLGVIAALPLASATTSKAAGAGAIVGGKLANSATKSVLAKLGFGAILGPVVGLAITLLGAKAAQMNARSPQERRYVARHARWTAIYCAVMSIGLAVTLTQAGKRFTVSPGWLVFGIFAWVALLVIPIWIASLRFDRAVARIRAETEDLPDSSEHAQLESTAPCPKQSDQE